MRRALALLAALAAAATAACGNGAGAGELSPEDGERLALSRERIAAAVETYERLSRSQRAAERLLARVRKIVATGALEPERLDEFGLAALGELGLVVPALVIYDERRIPRELDRESLRRFLRNATGDPSAAIRRPAATEVRRIGTLLESADAEADTRIESVDATVASYLEDVEARLRPVWPDLAGEVAAIRAELA